MTRTRRLLYVVTAAAMLAAGCRTEAPSASVEIDEDDIGGVVTSTDGPEAGVWVIAETDDFETMFVRIVVTDDEGRYVSRICPRRITDSGFEDTDSPTRKRSKRRRAITSISARSSRRMPQPPPKSTRPRTGTR